MEVGDYVVASLQGNRVGRLGQITSKSVGDEDWEPLVPISPDEPEGEMGRRIQVRWSMTVGPDDRDIIVLLPENSRFTGGELRPTISEIRSMSRPALEKVMNDRANWQSLFSHFDYERALSGYIATYPHHLEDGMTEHPSEKIRERVFKNKSRSDVILLDGGGWPVIVECKQGQPAAKDINQLRGYLHRFRQETGLDARGILVHGGALKLHDDVRRAAAAKPVIEMIRHKLEVEFSRCN
jgi:hypothetical protein